MKTIWSCRIGGRLYSGLKIHRQWFNSTRLRKKERYMDKEFEKRFLMNRDETGRFIVKSKKTGKTYYVEPIDGKERTSWGDYNPATKTFETSNYGKYKGSVRPDESMITEENGFDKIHTLGEGESPLDYINRIDDEYFEKMK